MTLARKNILRGGVVVCQRGARHRYAIPRLFEEAGLLAALYTDSSVCSPVGRFAAGLFGLGRIVSPSVRALSLRVPTGIPPEKVFSSDRLLVPAFLRGTGSPGLSSTYTRWGLQGADVVYSMYGEDLEFLKWAKARGAKIVVDIFISPLSNQVVLEEQERFNAPERYCVDPLECRVSSERGIGAIAPLADILLCPSEWVAEGVRHFVPGHSRKIRVVPYGSSLHPRDQQGENVGRILFAGRDPLRKGLPYLAEAAHLLRQTHPELKLDIRVAGLDGAECSWFPHHGQLNCLGLVEMDRMGDEFSKADAFVLPSLSEGQAGVVLEALSYGCPVIATRESGVDFIDGENGVLVAARSAGQLEAAILRIVRDRTFRNRISQNGKAFFQEVFSMDAWRERLVDVVLGLCDPGEP